MESKVPVPVASNYDIPRVADKSKKDMLEDSGSQVSSSGDDSFHESASDFGSGNLVPDIHGTKPNLVLSQEVPEPELTTGSASSDPESAAPISLIPAAGPPGSSGKLAPDVHDDSARPWSPDAKNGSARPPADRSQSSSSSLKEFRTFFDLHDYTSSTSSRHDDLLETKISSQERKTYPELADYDSQDSSSPGHLLESQPSSNKEAKAYPDLASYDSEASPSPGNVSESQPSSRETKAYPDLPSYDSQDSPRPANWWETEKFGSDEKGTNLGNLVEGSVDLDPLAGRNWRKSVEAVPGIAPAVAHHEDSNSTELCSHTSSGSHSSSDSD